MNQPSPFLLFHVLSFPPYTTYFPSSITSFSPFINSMPFAPFTLSFLSICHLFPLSLLPLYYSSYTSILPPSSITFSLLALPPLRPSLLSFSFLPFSLSSSLITLTHLHNSLHRIPRYLSFPISYLTSFPSLVTFPLPFLQLSPLRIPPNSFYSFLSSFS